MPTLVKDLLLAVLFVCLTMVFTNYVKASGGFPATSRVVCGDDRTPKDCSGAAAGRCNNQAHACLNSQQTPRWRKASWQDTAM